MKVLRYCCPLFVCVLHVILDSSAEAQSAGQRNSHVKQSGKNLHTRDDKISNGAIGKPFKTEKNVLNEKRRDSHFLVTKQDGSLSGSLQTRQRIIAKGNKIHVRVESPTGVASKNLVRSHNIHRLRDKDISAKVVSNLTSSKDKTKLIASNSRKTEKRKKKTLFKKYALLQSLPLLQTQAEPEQPVLTGGDESNAGYALQVQGDQTGDAAAVQEQSPDDQQQQSLSDGNSLGQYALSQDSTSYQQDSSQPSTANLADSNIEDAAQSEDGQPSSLEQAVQLQQAGYTQHSQEQEQDQDAPLPISQGGELAGQENQVVSNAQLQYQNQQAGQEQEQPMQEQEEQDQAPGQSNYEQAGFQQEQPQQLDQQESREMDQQPQDQIQDYQQQQDEGQQQQEQQQIVEEPQETQGAPSETQGAPSETQSPSSSSNSYGTVFSAESQSPGSEQQSQGTLSYSNDQNNDNGEKVARPSVQYAASIEEALKEPGVSSQESNSEGGDAQGGVDENEGANVLNVRPETDSKGSEENGFVGTGSISAPTGYQTSVVDDNGNPIQTSPNQEVNGYASPYEQQGIGDTNALEGNQPPQSTSLLETQYEQNFAEQQPQHQSSGPNRPKVSPVEDDVLKIISIDNKNAPNAVNGCKGCPPHARCINKVCIINDDQPLAHILSALSGPEPAEASEANECKECHYNAKCINKECVCKAGYTGDGIDCRPDTCLPGCKEHGKCIKGFCLCDHHHYFNGYECSPYKITHRNCPIQCTTSCHAKCPANCCKQHPVIKTHYSEDNPQQIGEAVSVNGLLSKGKNGPNPPEVVLKPFVKVGQPIANFAPDFQSRPHDSDDSDLEAVHVKHPLGSFTMTETDTNPLFGEDDCPDKCNNECLDICPVKCCLKRCPLNCMEDCNPSCPKTCCYLNSAKIQFPMMDSTTQENFIKMMAEKFCPRACKNVCDPKCSPICCEGNSTSTPLKNNDFGHLKSESKKKTDFMKKAMSWFGMMNFLNMMYSMYGNMNGLKQMKLLYRLNDSKAKALHPTKSTSLDAKTPMPFKQVGAAESPDDSNDTCPSICKTTCVHSCPQRCCHDKVKTMDSNTAAVLPRCQPSCQWFCSNSCPKNCCVKDMKSALSPFHPTVPVTKAKSSLNAVQVSSLGIPSKAHSTCKATCPAYCYPLCLEDCCERGVVPKKPTVAQLKAKQSFNNFFAKVPDPSNQNCPALCQNNCTPSCPVVCCDQSASLPTQSRLIGSSNGHACPGGCVSECFPACTISCCRAAVKKQDSTLKPTRRQYQPLQKPLSTTLPPPSTVCHHGCSRLCYPNCDESCCRAASGLSPGLRKSKEDGSTPSTIKVPCPSECRPFNCLYYCHHDCCLQGKQQPFLKYQQRRNQASILQTKKKYLIRNAKTLAIRRNVEASDKSTFGGRLGNKRTAIRHRPQL